MFISDIINNKNCHFKQDFFLVLVMLKYMLLYIYCEMISAITLFKSLMQPFKTKYIEIKYQLIADNKYNFISDYVQKSIFDIKFIDICKDL